MSVLRQALAVPPLSPTEWRFLRTVADDTEDAPWMVMSEPQWRSASALFWSLDVYAQTHPVAWHPGARLPLTYRPPANPAPTWYEGCTCSLIRLSAHRTRG